MSFFVICLVIAMTLKYLDTGIEKKSVEWKWTTSFIILNDIYSVVLIIVIENSLSVRICLLIQWRQDIPEILLKLALNTKQSILFSVIAKEICFFSGLWCLMPLSTIVQLYCGT